MKKKKRTSLSDDSKIPDLFNKASEEVYTDKDAELQKLMFENKSANNKAATKKYFKNRSK